MEAKESKNVLQGRQTTRRPPLWVWLNVLSLDAVLVGVLWQGVLVSAYCERWPRIWESMVIGIAIWLVYTADRLFDSVHLNLDRPHTLRHLMHLRHRGWFASLWLVLLIVGSTLVICCADPHRLRWGYVAVAMVAAYMFGVQWSRSDRMETMRRDRPGPKRTAAVRRVLQRTFLAKELQAGLIFAFGVSLIAWSENETRQFGTLAVSTLLVGCLFTTNCASIALWECEQDHEQGFRSWVFQTGGRRAGLVKMVGAQMVITLLLVLWGAVPTSVLFCLFSSLFLLLLLIVARPIQSSRHRCAEFSGTPITLSRSDSGDRSRGWFASGRAWPTRMNADGLFADLALMIPPAICVVLGAGF